MLNTMLKTEICAWTIAVKQYKSSYTLLYLEESQETQSENIQNMHKS